MKRVLFLVAILLSLTTANAAENILHTIDITPAGNSYNISLQADSITDVKQNTRTANKISIKLNNIKASSNLTVKYNSPKIDTVFVKKEGKNLSISIQGDLIANSNIYLNKNHQITAQNNNFKTYTIIGSILLLLFSGLTQLFFNKKKSNKLPVFPNNKLINNEQNIKFLRRNKITNLQKDNFIQANYSIETQEIHSAQSGAVTTMTIPAELKTNKQKKCINNLAISNSLTSIYEKSNKYSLADRLKTNVAS